MEQLGFLLVIGFLAILVLGAMTLVNRASEPPPPKYPYRKTGKLLSDGELRFFLLLWNLIDDQTVIFTKVRLADLVKVDRSQPEVQKWQNKINQKHADFVLCDFSNCDPYLVIELDDSSHNSPKAQARDREKNAILEAAGVALLRVKVTSRYDSEELKSEIQSAHAAYRKS